MQVEQWQAQVDMALKGRLSELGALNELRRIVGLQVAYTINREVIEEITTKVKELQNG